MREHPLLPLGEAARVIEERLSGADVVPPLVTWPSSLEEKAFLGLAGDVVRQVLPNTEADPAALLLQVLVAFGVCVGRNPHFFAGSGQHNGNLFLLLCGDTAAARKGTSWGVIRGIFRTLDSWKPEVSGLSSGEGLKYAVRDARIVEEWDSKAKCLVEKNVPGVEDKRLLVIEEEFASVLKVASRSGSTLSATLRSAWDTGDLATLTKNDSVVATGTHIAVIAHITLEELRSQITETDIANGFANRFLFACVSRSKCLPFSGESPPGDIPLEMRLRLNRALSMARRRTVVPMVGIARDLWDDRYPELSEGSGDLCGAATARGAPQVLRMAFLYALLEEEGEIRLEHLEAALECWRYCKESAEHVLLGGVDVKAARRIEDILIDKLAGKVAAAVLDNGGVATRTEIRRAVGTRYKKAEIDEALDRLEGKGYAKESVGKGCRATEFWRKSPG